MLMPQHAIGQLDEVSQWSQSVGYNPTGIEDHLKNYAPTLVGLQQTHEMCFADHGSLSVVLGSLSPDPQYLV